MRNAARSVWNLLRDKNVSLPVGATLVGIGMVATGWIIVGSQFVPGLLQEIGSALVLLMPLLFLGRLLEARTRRTEEHTRAISSDLAKVRSDVSVAAARLDALNAISREDIGRLDERRAQALADAERMPVQDNVVRILNDAAIVGAVAPDGVRVRVGGTAVRMRFRLPGSTPESAYLPVTLEDPDGRAFADVAWAPGESAEALARRVRDGRWPALAGATGDATGCVRELLGVLRRAVAGRTGESPVDIGAVVERVNDQWVISADGLYCASRSYHIPTSRLLDRHDDWPRHMGTKEWVDQEYFADAYALALALLAPASA